MRKVKLRRVETQKKNEKDYASFWNIGSFVGLLFFLGSSILGAYFKIVFLSRASFLGLVVIFIPLIVFQFNLFAGSSDLKLEKSDLKSLWFWMFNIIFFIINAFVFLSVNMIFNIMPEFEIDNLLSNSSIYDSLPYFAGFYAIIIGVGLIYRYKHKPHVMRIA